MPGYEIVERSSLKPFNPNGFEEYENKIGFIDFLREVKNEANDLLTLSSYMVIGIDDVLYFANPSDRHSIERKIHSILQTAASSLERKKIQVQIVCKGKLKKGETLWIEYRGDKLDLELIFGSTHKHSSSGLEKYMTGFNLSS